MIRNVPLPFRAVIVVRYWFEQLFIIDESLLGPSADNLAKGLGMVNPCIYCGE